MLPSDSPTATHLAPKRCKYLIECRPTLPNPCEEQLDMKQKPKSQHRWLSLILTNTHAISLEVILKILLTKETMSLFNTKFLFWNSELNPL